MGDNILQGQRGPDTNQLWHLNINNNKHQANLLTASNPSATPAELVAFAHAALFSPVAHIHTTNSFKKEIYKSSVEICVL